MGWYDGNPSRLWQHTPVEAGKRYVDFMGGADAVVEKARASFEAGDLPLGGAGARPRGLRGARPRGGEGAARPTCSSSSASGARTARGAARSCPGLDGAARRGLRHPDESRPPPTSSRSSAPTSSSTRSPSRSTGRRRGTSTSPRGGCSPTHDGATYRVTLKNGVLTHVRDGHGDATLTVTVPKAALGPLAIGDVEARDWAPDSRSTATRARCSRCSACSTRATPTSTS